METKQQQEEILIARNNDTGQVGAVTGLNKDGTPKMTDVKSASLADLVRFSKGQNPMEAFLSNFVRQCKNPSTFGFFKVPADRFESVGQAMADLMKEPEKNAEMLKDFKVEAPQQTQEQEQTVAPKEETSTPSETKSQAIDESRIDWEEIEKKWGVDRNFLEKNGLSDMLHNRKSKLVTIKIKIFDETFDIKARLSFVNTPDGKVKIDPHFIKETPNLNQKFNGVKFTPEDKQMLELTGNLGRVVELTDEAGNKVPSLVSIDRKTNELESVPVQPIRIPPKISNTELSQKDFAILKAGKQLDIQFTDKKGDTYPVVLQYSASEKKVEFVPRGCRLSEMQNTKQENGQSQSTTTETHKELKNSWVLPDGRIKPIGKWGNYLFNEQEKADYVAGKTIKIDNYVDKAGKVGTVYVKFDPKLQKGQSYPSDPDKAQSIKPAQESATQFAVNNDGKTNEATNKVDEPLQKGQVAPKDEEQQKQQRKSKGLKV